MATLHIEPQFIVDCANDGVIDVKITEFSWNSHTNKPEFECEFRWAQFSPVDYEDDDLIHYDEYRDLEIKYEELKEVHHERETEIEALKRQVEELKRHNDALYKVSAELQGEITEYLISHATLNDTPKPRRWFNWRK